MESNTPNPGRSVHVNQVLMATREEVVSMRERVNSLEASISSLSAKIDHLDKTLIQVNTQLTFGKGFIGALMMFAGLIGAGVSLLFGLLKQAVTNGIHQ
jgi:uncharacterized protein YlxW (UPF0749 family)